MHGRAMIIGVGGAAAVVAVTWAVGAVTGFGSFATAWTVHFAMMAWMSGLLDAARPGLRGDWFRVRAWEPGVYRRAGVWWYMRLLRAVGWERLNRAGRRFDGTRESLPAFDLATRRSELAHLVLAAIGTVLVVVAVAFRSWGAAGWLAVLNVVLHCYPVLLQRAVRFRLQRLARVRT
ncbi:hypothetical protein AB0F81_18085 [Actinoplanes sp. NPDC024001]|uniref:glycosyl-4,4'-diaponeurosporenoate acyltransferase CrtO family protein n=1 Tax=Actinoplanes sp. NPDC024001 TaxID=3154598 RepID=UPI003410AC4D